MSQYTVRIRPVDLEALEPVIRVQEDFERWWLFRQAGDVLDRVAALESRVRALEARP